MLYTLEINYNLQGYFITIWNCINRTIFKCHYLLSTDNISQHNAIYIVHSLYQVYRFVYRAGMSMIIVENNIIDLIVKAIIGNRYENTYLLHNNIHLYFGFKFYHFPTGNYRHNGKNKYT